MKNSYYILLMIFLCISCSKTDDVTVNEAVILEDENLKTLTRDPIYSNIDDHKELLDRNSFIVGEVLRINSPLKFYVSNALDNSNSVLMSDLLIPNTSFWDTYVYVATHASSNFRICGNPDSNTGLWPPSPLNPLEPVGSKTTYAIPSVDLTYSVSQFINYLQTHRTELHVKNLYASGDVYTVGHPLVQQHSNSGIIVYNPPLNGYVSSGLNILNLCSVYSEDESVGPQNQVDNDLIILSRPNLDLGNPYPYINVDINTFLIDLGNPNGSGMITGQ